MICSMGSQEGGVKNVNSLTLNPLAQFLFVLGPEGSFWGDKAWTKGSWEGQDSRCQMRFWGSSGVNWIQETDVNLNEQTSWAPLESVLQSPFGFCDPRVLQLRNEVVI